MVKNKSKEKLQQIKKKIYISTLKCKDTFTTPKQMWKRIHKLQEESYGTEIDVILELVQDTIWQVFFDTDVWKE